MDSKEITMENIIEFINKNITKESQLQESGLRGMGLDIKELPQSYNARQYKTDSGIEYYISYRNKETREKLYQRLTGIVGGKVDMDELLHDNGKEEEKIGLKEKLDQIFRENKQVIFTGAPGTGKTYTILQYVKEQAQKSGDEYDFVQFHSSYDYSDFVEGLRPVQLLGHTETSFVRMDGVFKNFCRKIVEKNMSEKKNDRRYYFVIDEINRADLSNVFGELMFGLEEDYREKKITTQYQNLPTYVRDQGKNEIVPLEQEKDVFKDGFYIPENLYLIGTMNDIDRSVEAFDFALRRRFRWVEVKANEEMSLALSKMLGKNGLSEKDIRHFVQRVIAMNGIISKQTNLGLNEEYHIGPAYFKNYDGSNLTSIWNSKIEPILREYCRGRNGEAVEQFVGECRRELFEEADV